ncbi:sodium/hydrogen exchanger 9B2-like [Convolutriloba macropyga]|uniref:sodium/hydrogen exchanger 9B2-like n=1 Tax=Convolutriloba macropyga TaxID=536237 RepID=UPI003F527954
MGELVVEGSTNQSGPGNDHVNGGEFTHRQASTQSASVSRGVAAANETPAVSSSSSTSPAKCCNGRLCDKVQSSSFVSAFRVRAHPLPDKPTAFQKARWHFQCPPHGRVAWVLTRVVGFLIGLGALYGLLGPDDARPEVYIFVLYIISRLTGFLVSLAKLPPLLGMLMAGICMSNVNSHFGLIEEVEPYWKEVLRDVAFITILIRAGLSLNPKGVLEMSGVVVRLAFCPGVVTEGPVVAILAHFLLGLPLLWALMLGFILAAVSPAVVVPSLLSLQNRGYGVDQGVPTLIIAAASIDDIIAISAFSVVLSINFADHSSGGIWIEILRAPLEVIIGVAAALVIGVIMWYVPPPKKNELDLDGRPKRKQEDHTTARFLMLFGSGILFMFGARKLHLAGAGALGTLCAAFFTGLGWDMETKMPVGTAFGHAWNSLMPLLFGLIGSEIDLKVLADPNIILSSLGVIIGGLSARFLATFLAVQGAGFNVRERIFVSIAWIPKATVQAAMGSIPLDLAREQLERAQHHSTSVVTQYPSHINHNLDINGTNLTSTATDNWTRGNGSMGGNISMSGDGSLLSSDGLELAEKHKDWGVIIITVAVLAILISAPIGAIGIGVTGDKLLQKSRRQRRFSRIRPQDGQPRPLHMDGEQMGGSSPDCEDDFNSDTDRHLDAFGSSHC